MSKYITTVPRLPVRNPDGHKGSFGRVIVVAGSRGLTGAAILSGSAVLRGGAGLATVATPAECQSIVTINNPCLMTFALPQDDAGRVGITATQTLAPLVETADVLAVGPGLGRGAGPTAVVLDLLTKPKPMVLDADGLNSLGIVSDSTFAHRRTPTILTPHAGEFARLLGVSREEVQAHRESLALGFAKKFQVTLLLKGHATVVTDGTRLYVNTTGNPGMATGGAGDVLTGLIAALLAQGMSGLDAAVTGAWVHGRAGDLAAATLGPVGLVATDILDQLPRALWEVIGTGE